MKALIYGGSGGLAQSLIKSLTARHWAVEIVTRKGSSCTGEAVFCAEASYAEYVPDAVPDAIFFPQSVYFRKPLVETSEAEIEDMLRVGLVDIVKSLRGLLAVDTDPDRRTDYALIGSTAAYAGFGGTTVYCAMKHALVGLVKALNDEYVKTNKRFWLFSMGTMDTPMGRNLTEFDPTSLLDPDAVADRIVESLMATGNLFEPEVIMRRRHMRLAQT